MLTWLAQFRKAIGGGLGSALSTVTATIAAGQITPRAIGASAAMGFVIGFIGTFVAPPNLASTPQGPKP